MRNAPVRLSYRRAQGVPTKAGQAVRIGAPDPERRNSPIIVETDEEFEFAGQELDEVPVCYFNENVYQIGAFVCSGSERLRCVRDGWVQSGSCDSHGGGAGSAPFWSRQLNQSPSSNSSGSGRPKASIHSRAR